MRGRNVFSGQSSEGLEFAIERSDGGFRYVTGSH